MEANTMKADQTAPIMFAPGLVAQVANLTADPGVASSIRALSHTFLAIEHEIISAVILLLPLIQEWLLLVTRRTICRKNWLIA